MAGSSHGTLQVCHPGIDFVASFYAILHAVGVPASCCSGSTHPVTLLNPASAAAGVLASFRHYTSPDSSPPHSQWRHPEERRQGRGRLRGGWRPTADTRESQTPWWRDTRFVADSSIAALPWSCSHHRPQWLTNMQHRTQSQQQTLQCCPVSAALTLT